MSHRHIEHKDKHVCDPGPCFAFLQIHAKTRSLLTVRGQAGAKHQMFTGRVKRLAGLSITVAWQKRKRSQCRKLVS